MRKIGGLYDAGKGFLVVLEREGFSAHAIGVYISSVDLDFEGVFSHGPSPTTHRISPPRSGPQLAKSSSFFFPHAHSYP